MRTATARRLLRTEDRTKDRFQAINRVHICPGTNFQGEKLILVTENSVETSVQLRERLERGVLTKNAKSAEAKAAGTLAEEGTR